MRSIVSFLIDHDETTDDLDTLITDTALDYAVVDHEVKVDVGDDEHLDRLLAGISWEERGRIEAAALAEPRESRLVMSSTGQAIVRD